MRVREKKQYLTSLNLKPNQFSTTSIDWHGAEFALQLGSNEAFVQLNDSLMLLNDPPMQFNCINW